MKQRTLLTPGYKALNGYIFTSYDCDQYNRIQTEINTHIQHNRTPPNHLLNHSHLTFNTIIKKGATS